MDEFQTAFGGHADMLGMQLVDLVQNHGWQKLVEQEGIGWDKFRLESFYDDASPTGEEFRAFLNLKEVQALAGTGDKRYNALQKFVIEFAASANVAAESALAELSTTDAVADTQEPEAVVAEEPEAVVQAVVEASPVVVNKTDVAWTLDTVQVGDAVYELRKKTSWDKKSIRTRVYEKLEAIRHAGSRVLTVEEFSNKLRENKSTYNNFKNENTYLNQERAEKWASNLGISVRELLGYPPLLLDNAAEQTSLPAEEPEAVVAEEPTLSEEAQDKLDVLNCIRCHEIDSERVHELMTLFLEGKVINYKAVVLQAAAPRLREVANSVSALCTHPAWKQIRGMSLADFIARFDQE